MEDDRGIKVVLLGESGVGKTNLIRVSTGKGFEKNENSTITSAYYEEETYINKKRYSYFLWDTAGQEIYRSLNKIFIKDSKIVMIVFAINSKQSFEQIDFWYKYVRDILGDDGYIIALVANKSDLFESQEITEQEMNKKAEELGVKIKVTSAAVDAVGFKSFLNELLKDYIDKYNPEEVKQPEQPETFKINKENNEDKNVGENGKQKKKCC